MPVLDDGYHSLPPGKLASVVTTLAMTARPVPRAERAFDGVALRAIAPAARDLTWYRTLYRRVGEEWLWFSRLRMPDADLLQILGDPAVAVYALSLDGLDEGLLELDFRTAGECELAFFGLTAAARGRGAGRWLMNRALELAWSAPVQRVWVHSCTLDHPAALAFYRRSGFIPVSRQVEVADDPRLTGTLDAGAAPELPLL